MDGLISAAMQPSDIPRFTASPEGRDALHKMLEEALALSDELFELQEVRPLHSH